MPEEVGKNLPAADFDETAGIKFEWYPPKAKSNLRKHGVSFEEAKSIVGDGNFLDFPDREHSEDELRMIGIGRSEKDRYCL